MSGLPVLIVGAGPTWFTLAMPTTRATSVSGNALCGFSRLNRRPIVIYVTAPPLAIRFLTFDTCHLPPRAVGTPRALRAAARATQIGDAGGLQRADDRQHVGGEAIRLGDRDAAERSRLRRIHLIASRTPAFLRSARTARGALADEPPFLHKSAA
jgi:hypothetical protein